MLMSGFAGHICIRLAIACQEKIFSWQAVASQNSMLMSGEFQVSFLRKSMKGKGNCFFFPNNIDEATVNESNIIGVLPSPIP